MYSFIDSNEKTLQSIKELKAGQSYAIDTESQGLDPYTCELLLIQVGSPDGSVNIYDARKIDTNVMKYYLDCLFQTADRLLFHSAKFDWKFLLHNYKVSPPKGKIYDTQLTEGVLYNGLTIKGASGKEKLTAYASLLELTKKYCNVSLEKETRLQFIGYNEDAFSEEILEYSAKDVQYLFDIASNQQYFLAKNELNEIADLEGSLTIVVAAMELAGVELDPLAWLAIYQQNVERQEQQLEDLQLLVRKLVPDGSAIWVDPKSGKEKVYNFSKETFNPRSYQQTLAIMWSRGFDKLDSSNSDLLEKLDDEIAKAIIEYRKTGKLTSSYGTNIIDLIHPITKRIHGRFNQLGATSGRFSSDSPNLQNMPARTEIPFRACFVTSKGRVQINADYSNIEMRLAGEFSGDEAIIKAYTDGIDLHKLSAAAMYGVPFDEVTKEQRSNGKTFNFSVLYGASAFKVSNSLQIPISQAEVMVANWRAGFPKLAAWLDETAKFLKENGYVKTFLGRRRYFDMPSPGASDYWKTINRFVREGCNHPIQGTSADMTKTALINIYYAILDYDAEIIRTVHDEISVECDEEIGEAIKNIVVKEMIKAGQLFIKSIPVQVDAKVGLTWDH